MGYNDVTGAPLISKPANENYYSNYDRIFGKKPKLEVLNGDIELQQTSSEESSQVPSEEKPLHK